MCEGDVWGHHGSRKHRFHVVLARDSSGMRSIGVLCLTSNRVAVNKTTRGQQQGDRLESSLRDEAVFIRFDSTGYSIITFI